MRNRGNKVILHFFWRAQLLGHIVDGIAEIANLVVVWFSDPHLKVALGDSAGHRADFSQGLHNWSDKIGVGKHHKENHHTAHQKQQADRHKYFSVRRFQGNHIPHGAHIVSGGAVHRLCNRHHLFAGIQRPGPNSGALVGAFGQLIIGHRLLLVHLKSGRGNQASVMPVKCHQLHLFLIGKRFHIIDRCSVKPGIIVQASGKITGNSWNMSLNGRLDTVIIIITHNKSKA